MKLLTNRFGEIELNEDHLYTFAKGIPGFETHHKFVLLAPEQDEPFKFLQAVEDPELMFVIADPFLFYPDYEFDLPDSAIEELGIQSPDQVRVHAIISIHGDLESATVNLVAPVIMNRSSKLAKQVVLSKTAYSTRHPLFAASKQL
ncbi:flagellar assembly protein FliW [Paenibacillus spongiae]|uniref:Flagellar assembly factor FliW n=1 Tax=Paenibacillus spongiae TaxID=2909671 RepID=A0ABY5S8A1_9BACL|nr:flagellar assembly protein FliW [Paenibacillus spongiae]UVI29894.1 flagellar assembly protein FliW [Paenibacillus spongiae]